MSILLPIATMQQVLAGGLAGSISTFIGNPFDVVKVCICFLTFLVRHSRPLVYQEIAHTHTHTHRYDFKVEHRLPTQQWPVLEKFSCIYAYLYCMYIRIAFIYFVISPYIHISVGGKVWLGFTRV